MSAIKGDLDAIYIGCISKALVNGERSDSLAAGFRLHAVEGHVVLIYARCHLEGIFSLEVIELHPSVHIQQPESIDIINDQAVCNSCVRRAFYYPSNVCYDIRKQIQNLPIYLATSLPSIASQISELLFH